METFLIVIIIIFALTARLYGPTYFTKRSVRPVIMAFKRVEAYNAETARSLAELNLSTKSGFGQFTKMGSYRLKALEALQQTSIVNITEEGSYYLDIKNLMASRLVERWPLLAQGLPKEE